MEMKSTRPPSAEGPAPEDPALSENSAGKSPKQGEAPAGDAKRLKDALKNTNKNSGNDAPTPAPNQQPAEGLTSLFSQAMGALAGQAMNMQPPPAAAPVAPDKPATTAPAAPVTARSEVTAAQCNELVDRILASPPSPDGSAEVRIKIDKPWLPDTEVRLTLSPNAKLEVEFMADSPDSQRFLLPNLGSLRERLVERTGGEVAVRMTEKAHEGIKSAGDASGGNSAGDSSGDGRSRNRRNIIKELEEET